MTGTPTQATQAPLRLLARAAVWLLAVALIALPLLGALRGWYAADRWPLRHLEINTDLSRVNADQVRRTIMPHIRNGFFASELEPIRSAIQGIPWVAQAEVRKQWPDRLIVRIREYRAAATWNDRMLLTARGTRFEVPGSTVPEGLVRLSGPEPTAQTVLAFAQHVVPLLRRLNLRADEVALSERGSWHLKLASGDEIIIGHDQPEMRLARFLRALPALRPPTPATHAWMRADLRYSNGFAITWRLPEQQPAPGTVPAPAAPETPHRA